MQSNTILLTNTEYYITEQKILCIPYIYINK